MKKAFISIAAVLLLALAACKKDKNTAPDTTSVTKENIVGTYSISKVTETQGGNPETDVTITALQTCERDDLYKFNADMTYQVVDAGERCPDPGDYTSTWALKNSTLITIDEEDFTIKQFDGKNLVVTLVNSDQAMTLYFVKQ